MTELNPSNRIQTQLADRLSVDAHAPSLDAEGAGEDESAVAGRLGGAERRTGPVSAARLRLRKLIVHGFKSFADRTEFVFDRPVVGVVGPNGCGKSNVVDAVKWVLGEQSAKSLRGEAMMDVIFNGAAGRQPGSFAEVTLVFDNPADESGLRPLPMEADEVAVGRQLLRDGTSHYKLNGRNARLKDVRDLFLDTGVGVDAYSVIEQGRVAAMLEASSAERRTIFEEAAGISRYKQKKKEAQRKLERVDQNLLRLTDIVEEVDRRLRSVKLAAGKARSYQELSGQLGELRLKSALHDYHTLTQRRAELTKRRDDAQFELDDAAGALQRAQNALAARREEFEHAGEARRQAEYSLVQTRGRIDQSRQRGEYAQQQIAQVEHQDQSLRAEHAETIRLAEENDAALRHDRAALERSSAEAEEAKEAIDARHTEHRDAQLRLAEINKAMEQAKAAILEAMNRSALADRRLSNIDIEQAAVGDRREKLAARGEQVASELASAEQRSMEHGRRLEELAASMSAEQSSLQARREEAAALGRALGEIGEKLVAAREQRSALLGRQKVLQDLEARREGVGEGVKHVLRERETRFSFIRGLVADLMRVDVEHAAVIEAALDGRDQWLIADAGADVVAAREAFGNLPGRVNVLMSRGSGFQPVFEHAAQGSEDRQDARPTDDPAALVRLYEQHVRATSFDWNHYDVPVRFAVDLVQCEPADRPLADLLLGRTVVVRTLKEAMGLHRDGPPGIRYVTRSGEVIEADGTFRAGPPGASMGILSRRSELAAVAHQVEESLGQIERLQAQLAEGNEQSRRIDAELGALRERIYELNAARVETAEKLSAEQDRVAALRREVPAVEAEITELSSKLDLLAVERAQLQERRESLRLEQSRQEAAVEELAAQQAALAERISAASEALTAARVVMGQVQEQQIAARRGVERHTSRQAELAQQIERIEASVKALDSRRAAAERERDAAEAERRRLDVEARGLAQRVDELSASLEAARSAVAELALAVDEAREAHDAAGGAVREAETALAELAIRLETLIARAAEETELDLPSRYAQIAGQEGGYQAEQQDWAAVAEQIKELRARIARLGNVNLDAIAEQEELESRATALAEQLRDLSDGKRQLEELIDTINRESGERFEQTFNAVREHFQTMFRKLFGGGRADIFLQTEVEEKQRDEEGKVTAVMRKLDPLEAGIEIVARPPGKQPVTISQLSGGEKTMTCVALLMSIFRSKPSPFCILDEVDAALDEANNVRFNRIVEEFLGESQFIIITHSKRTMQVADVLYGVTMQEQGVSKKVAVRFDEVGEGGRIHAEAAA